MYIDKKADHVRIYFKMMLNLVESTKYSRAIIAVHTQGNPITLPVVGIGEISRLNARCLSIVNYLNYTGQCG